MIVFDLDGTLADQDRKTKRSVYEITTEVHRRGAKITQVTGRTYDSARPLISQLEIEMPIILCNGAVILDPLHRAELYEHKIPPEIAMVVLMRAVQHKPGPIIYTDAVGLAASVRCRGCLADPEEAPSTFTHPVRPS